MKKKLLLAIIFIIASGIVLFKQTVFAQTSTDTPTPTPDNSSSIQDLQNKINGYEDKIKELSGQEQTLSSQIQVMDSQINLTQARIDSTKQQISTLQDDIQTTTKHIGALEGSLEDLTKVLLNRIVENYVTGQTQPIQVLLTSQNATDFLRRESYLQSMQEHDQKLAYDTVQAKNDYNNQKNIFEEKKKKIEALQSQLQDYSKQLDSEKADKQNLLSQTQGSEATYQRLLSQARAQLAGFQNFVRVQGGASLLSGQTDCSDSWGCYYNQRDTEWGSIGINGSQYSIAEDGCLMTSMAMVITHYGHKVTPLDINAPGNFFSSTAYLLYTISAGGVSAQRTGAAIDATLNDSNHDPVIVGISYDSGPIPDHFVVLVSGSGGSYTMNDPFTPNGHNIPFTSKYSLGSIREIDKVVIE